MIRERRFDLVASDLDGTLLHTDDRITARTKAAVHRAIAAGATFVYATGRPPRWVDPVVEGLDHYGYAVASNGAYVLDLSIDHDHDRIIARNEIDRASALAAGDAIRSMLPDVAFALDGIGGFAHEPGYRTRFDLPAGVRVGLLPELLDRPYAKLMFRHPSMSNALFAELTAALGHGVMLTFGATPQHHVDRDIPDAETLIEVQQLGVSKAAALRWVCEHIGHDAHSGKGALAFGDMPNDLEMLRWAEHGVAMANAHDDLKAVADEITASNDDDGVALVLEREFPLG